MMQVLSVNHKPVCFLEASDWNWWRHRPLLHTSSNGVRAAGYSGTLALNLGSAVIDHIVGEVGGHPQNQRPLTLTIGKGLDLTNLQVVREFQECTIEARYQGFQDYLVYINMAVVKAGPAVFPVMFNCLIVDREEGNYL